MICEGSVKYFADKVSHINSQMEDIINYDDNREIVNVLACPICQFVCFP